MDNDISGAGSGSFGSHYFGLYRLEILYDEEFDPGSGWTLATGLTHASRGAAGFVLAQIAGDRRTGA